jgi:ATP adenylyltransferase
VAGAGLPGHVHVHIVPRWKGDNNFLPVVSDVRLVPERVEDTYKRLKPLFGDGDARAD